MNLLIRANSLRIPLADRSVHCCVTSPPYWGLRDYGIAGQLGLEPTPEAYVAAMVAIFREVYRVLRDDGTLWLNIGDSYATKPIGSGSTFDPRYPAGRNRAEGFRCGRTNNPSSIGCKHKDMVGIPWMLAFALRADGWYLRSEIIWAKPNGMPESIRDRPSKSHELVFLLTKKPRYFYDKKAIEEARKTDSLYPGNIDPGKIQGTKAHQGGNSQFRDAGARAWGNLTGKNSRSVWTISTTPFKGAHFATMPVKLAEKCIKAGCPKDGIVFDPFGGAMTTVLAAERLGRVGIATELKPEYIEIGQRRLLRPHAKPPRVGKIEESYPLFV